MICDAVKVWTPDAVKVWQPDSVQLVCVPTPPPSGLCYPFGLGPFGHGRFGGCDA